MACLLATAAEAVVVSIVKKHQEKKEEAALHIEHPAMESEGIPEAAVTEGKIPFSRKIGWLSNMLWGGSYLLLIEHIWHGEIVPWFPFLTAMYNAEDTTAMLQEIASVGTSMAVLITAVWGVMLAAVHIWETKKSGNPEWNRYENS